MDGACGIYGRDEKCIKILVEKPEGKIYEWEYNVKQLGCEVMDWIHLVHWVL